LTLTLTLLVPQPSSAVSLLRNMGRVALLLQVPPAMAAINMIGVQACLQHFSSFLALNAQEADSLFILKYLIFLLTPVILFKIKFIIIMYVNYNIMCYIM
jgi:hypothetical protein